MSDSVLTTECSSTQPLEKKKKSETLKLVRRIICQCEVNKMTLATGYRN